MVLIYKQDAVAIKDSPSQKVETQKDGTTLHQDVAKRQNELSQHRGFEQTEGKDGQQVSGFGQFGQQGFNFNPMNGGTYPNMSMNNMNQMEMMMNMGSGGFNQFPMMGMSNAYCHQCPKYRRNPHREYHACTDH